MRESVAARARLAVCCVILACTAAVSACQSPAVDEALNVEDTIAPGLETFGSGPVVIGMITTLAGKSADPVAERDRRDGALFAAERLGADQITLALYNAPPTEAGIRAGAQALVDEGAKFLVGPSRPAQVAAARAPLTDSSPPLVALASNGAPAGDGVFTFVSDEVDGAVEAAAYAIGAGRKRVLVVHPPGMAATQIGRVSDGIEAGGGTVAGILPFSAEQDRQFPGSDEALRNTDAVLLLPGLDDPSAVVAALRGNDAFVSGTTVLGTTDWTPAQRAGAALAGALVCRFDQHAVGDVTERYRERFGRPMTVDAAYGFDAVALAAGIVRAHGADKLTAATLRAPSGFRGLMGAFRFLPSGAVERGCSIYRVEDGKLRLLDPAPESF